METRLVKGKHKKGRSCREVIIEAAINGDCEEMEKYLSEYFMVEIIKPGLLQWHILVKDAFDGLMRGRHLQSELKVLNVLSRISRDDIREALAKNIWLERLLEKSKLCSQAKAIRNYMYKYQLNFDQARAWSDFRIRVLFLQADNRLPRELWCQLIGSISSITSRDADQLFQKMRAVWKINFIKDRYLNESGTGHNDRTSRYQQAFIMIENQKELIKMSSSRFFSVMRNDEEKISPTIQYFIEWIIGNQSPEIYGELEKQACQHVKMIDLSSTNAADHYFIALNKWRKEWVESMHPNHNSSCIAPYMLEKSHLIKEWLAAQEYVKQNYAVNLKQESRQRGCSIL